MATRGTYEIDGVVFYCHWDNYPEGAARRFTKMLKCKDGDLAHRFVRGNTDAQVTESHDVHGDTEYKYRVWRDPDGVVQIIWHARDIDSDGWLRANIMTLSEYLGSFVEERDVEPCSPRGLLLEDAIREHDRFMQSIGEALTSSRYEVNLPQPGDWISCYRYFNWFEENKVSIGGHCVSIREVNLLRLETLRRALASNEFMTRYLNDKVSTVNKDV